MNEARLMRYFDPFDRYTDYFPATYLESVRGSDNPGLLQIYFVNNTGKPIEYVKCLYASLLDEAAPCKQPRSDLLYLNLAHGEACRLAEFHDLSQGGSTFELALEWKPVESDKRHMEFSRASPTAFEFITLEWH